MLNCLKVAEWNTSERHILIFKTPSHRGSGKMPHYHRVNTTSPENDTLISTYSRLNSIQVNNDDIVPNFPCNFKL